MTKTKVMVLMACASAIMVTGCNGPKKTCRKSANAYFKTLSSNDWKGMYNLLTEDHKKKAVSPKNLENFMLYELEYFGSKNFKLTDMQVYPGKDSCNATIKYNYAVKIRGQEEVQHDDNVETLILKRSPKDGLWYVELPAMSELSGF